MIYTPGVCAGTTGGVDFFVFSGYLYRMLPEDGGLVSLILQVRPLIRWIVLFFSCPSSSRRSLQRCRAQELTFRSQLPGGVACALS